MAKSKDLSYIWSIPASPHAFPCQPAWLLPGQKAGGRGGRADWTAVLMAMGWGLGEET